ncbi:hypothetical protein EDD75_0664 [Thermodesulfitimonas autotrophica]|uniref:RsgI N-terminal anti-sigma domain-containing protein n=1 Tax=Thermodesulfitimonas autotrophica TaxID=1894989 RepID=A0A3N5AXV1_9THEO|nr:anti-sigma factor domain-containing protein [Thermodesulfitimonas autotrophica]RPF49839.1 hypothetical protein EDD75_0664 [Thermodesulfitimonas autotrophica]
MRGMLVKDKGEEGIVLTPDGAFVQGKVEEAASLGDEVEVEPPLSRRSFWWLAAAAVAVVCLGLALYRLAVPAPWAYVAVDTVPSVGLALDSRLVVTRQEALNVCGEELLAGEKLAGKTFANALSFLLVRLRAEGYLQEAAGDLVLVTVASRKEDERLAAERVARLVAASLPAGRGTAVVVARVDLATQRQAAKAGLSPGRYLLQQELQQSGVKLQGRKVGEMPLRALEEAYGVRVAALMAGKAAVVVLGGDRNGKKPGGELPGLLAAPVPPAKAE